jgi:molybdate transport system substrate-binding protein
VIVVPQGDPAGIESLADLPKAQRIVLGAEQVPVGIYARAMLDRAETRYGEGFRERVESRVVSLEPNTRQVLAKVELGEADAAIVYRSDAIHSTRVETIAIPPELDEPTEYRIGRLQQAPHAALGDAWIELTLSAAGRAVLARHGFEVPDEP